MRRLSEDHIDFDVEVTGITGSLLDFGMEEAADAQGVIDIMKEATKTRSHPDGDIYTAISEWSLIESPTIHVTMVRDGVFSRAEW